MEFEWLKTGIGPVKNLLDFLSKAGKRDDIIKLSIIRELRNNLDLFRQAFMGNISLDTLVDLLDNKAMEQASQKNYKFKKLVSGRIGRYHIADERNYKYTGWDAEKLIDKIDEKIKELKNIKKMNGGSIYGIRNNIELMISNLFYRIKLLADFIRLGNLESNKIEDWPERGLSTLKSGLITSNKSDTKILRTVLRANKIDPIILQPSTSKITDQISLCPFVIFTITRAPEKSMLYSIGYCEGERKPYIILADTTEPFELPTNHPIINVNLRNEGFLNFIIQKPLNEIRQLLNSEP